MSKNTTRTVVALLCIAFFSMFLVSCTKSAGRINGQVVDDVCITSQIKAELLGDKKVSRLAISVETFQGEVVLTGAVDTVGQRNRVVKIARSVHGVKAVRNLIKIKL